MRILLVGEYSRLHNSLKEGLQSIGHQVTLISSGDGLKQYQSDYLLTSKIKKNILLKTLNKISIKLIGKDFIKSEFANQFKKLLPILKDFDVVQLINEDAIGTTPKKVLLFSSNYLNKTKPPLYCAVERIILQ